MHGWEGGELILHQNPLLERAGVCKTNMSGMDTQGGILAHHSICVHIRNVATPTRI